MTLSRQLYANNAKTTLTSAISSTDTTISVTDASIFPTIVNVGEYFRITLEANGILEIIIANGKIGNDFVGCLRGQEDTLASSFPSGTRVENRVTRDTLKSFARFTDRVADISSVDLLSPPINSDSNSYVCHSLEDGGNPIVAIRSTDFSWRFATHPTVVVAGIVTAMTFNSVNSSSLAGFPISITPGQYILQFISGPAAGNCRLLTASTTNTVIWGAPLDISASPGDAFEIYKSTSSTLAALSANSGDDGLIYSIILGD